MKAKMPSKNSMVFFVFQIFTLPWLLSGGSPGSSNNNSRTIGIGVVLDSNSPFKAAIQSYIDMAISDFYSLHSHSKTRLYCHYKQVDSLLDVASAVEGLVENEEVHGLIGVLNPAEATIGAQLGEKFHIPFISFSPSLYQSPYFIQVPFNDSFRAKAISSIFQHFNWTEAIVIYQQNDDSGNNLVSKLIQRFNEVGVQRFHTIPIPSSADDSYIEKQLNKTMELLSTVFVVHVNSISISSRLFSLARKLGMVNVTYAWIITDSLSNLMDSMSSSDIDSMDGSLGIRPYIPDDSKALENFKAKWKMDKNSVMLNAYGLWAYDIIWALSMALENIGEMNPSFSMSKDSNFRVSNVGQKLLEKVSRTKFEGLSGNFEIFEGKLQHSGVEIINILGSSRGRVVGYWSDDKGIVHKMEYNEGNPTYYSTSMKQLKTIIWPGDTFTKPIGWVARKGKLRIGVPEKEGFNEFVCVAGKSVSGISIQIFHCALNNLGFQLEYDFHPFKIGKEGSASYNDMLKNVANNYDILVSDATIMAQRAEYVEFALPYSESGVVMVVKNQRRVNMWIFIKPLRWDLWLTILAACIFIGVTLRFLEHRPGNNNIISESERQDDSLGLHLWFPITALAFPERNMVVNNWSRFVLVVWLFMAFILMQSYTAKLSSIFTVDQLRYDQNYNVGYQAGSFVKDLMIDTLRFPVTKLKPYSSIEEYHDAMTLGSKYGGFDAIFDELPYLSVFLRKYGNQYKMIGQTYKTQGFGFAFPIGSALVRHFSRAILEVTQNRSVCDIVIDDAGPAGYPYVYDDSSGISQDNPSLTAYDFGGLFIIVGSATLLAVFCSECPLGKAFCRKFTDCTNRWFSFSSLGRTTTGRVHSIERLDERKEDEPPTSLDHQESTAEVQLARSFEVEPPTLLDHQESTAEVQLPRSFEDDPPTSLDHQEITAEVQLARSFEDEPPTSI